MGKSIAISAGEASGDMYGACLAFELRNLLEDLKIWGAGGSKMASAGIDLAVLTTGGGTIGIAATLKTAPEVIIKYFKMRFELLRRKPDLFVPIDYGAFNIRLAQIAYKNGIPVVYYFPPGSWRKKPRNSEKLLACGGKVITPFSWSAEHLKNQGVDARFVGHPLVDIVKPSVSREQFFDEFGFDKAMPLIGLLPGSRFHEIQEHTYPMFGAAKIISQKLGGAQFVVAAADGRYKTIQKKLNGFLSDIDFPKVRVVENRTYDCMAHSDFIITSSGTASLEAAILGTPMIIVYQGPLVMRLEYILRKSILEDFIGLPNIIAGKMVCPEIIGNVTPSCLAEMTLSILEDKNKLEKMRNDLIGIKGQLGNSGAVSRAARMVVEMGGLK